MVGVIVFIPWICAPFFCLSKCFVVLYLFCTIMILSCINLNLAPKVKSCWIVTLVQRFCNMRGLVTGKKDKPFGNTFVKHWTNLGTNVQLPWNVGVIFYAFSDFVLFSLPVLPYLRTLHIYMVHCLVYVFLSNLLGGIYMYTLLP